MTKWDLPPEPIPSWLDPATEITRVEGTRPAKGPPFVVAVMTACLALGCTPRQAADVTANAINETGWGGKYAGWNLGGWKIRKPYVDAYKKLHGVCPPWSRAPGNKSSGDPPWCYYRAFPSLESYLRAWMEHFVPKPDDPKLYPGYATAGTMFWAGEAAWFEELIVVGYKGDRTRERLVELRAQHRAAEHPSVKAHRSLVRDALAMWAQSKLAVDVDGEWGSKSRAACAVWQRARGLEPTGELDDATLASLV